MCVGMRKDMRADICWACAAHHWKTLPRLPKGLPAYIVMAYIVMAKRTTGRSLHMQETCRRLGDTDIRATSLPCAAS